MDTLLVEPVKSKVPSGALVASTTGAAVVAPLIEIGLAAFGVDLPRGTGAAVAGLLGGLFHYVQGRGRSEKKVTHAN